MRMILISQLKINKLLDFDPFFLVLKYLFEGFYYFVTCGMFENSLFLSINSIFINLYIKIDSLCEKPKFLVFWFTWWL